MNMSRLGSLSVVFLQSKRTGNTNSQLHKYQVSFTSKQ